MPFSFKTSCAMGAIMAAMTSVSAFAQADQPVPQDAAPQQAIFPEDIVVTAERRESTVREVPFSIAAFGGELLREAQVYSPAALTQQMPGITINTADKSLSIVAIRGNVSTFRTATLDTPVAYFMDDVYYVFNNDLNANFYDTNRVEVLRGPQGTLFGRNVVGGAIAVVTNNPEFNDDYFAQISGGNGGFVRTEGMLNGALVEDKIAGRFAFSTEHSDGLIDTPNQPGRYGKYDSYSARGKLLFQPTDTLQVVLSGDYSYTKGNGGAIQLGIGGNQVIPDTFGAYTDDEWTNNDFVSSPYRQRLRGGYLRGDLDLLGGTLTSITGYRMNDSRDQRRRAGGDGRAGVRPPPGGQEPQLYAGSALRIGTGPFLLCRGCLFPVGRCFDDEHLLLQPAARIGRARQHPPQSRRHQHHARSGRQCPQPGRVRRSDIRNHRQSGCGRGRSLYVGSQEDRLSCVFDHGCRGHSRFRFSW